MSQQKKKKEKKEDDNFFFLLFEETQRLFPILYNTNTSKKTIKINKSKHQKNNIKKYIKYIHTVLLLLSII